MKITEERIHAEQDYAEQARLIKPVLPILQPWIDAEWKAAAVQIMSSGMNDDDRRELAAYMRAVSRLRGKIDQIGQRGLEAKAKLEKWSA